MAPARFPTTGPGFGEDQRVLERIRMPARLEDGKSYLVTMESYEMTVAMQMTVTENCVTLDGVSYLRLHDDNTVVIDGQTWHVLLPQEMTRVTCNASNDYRFQLETIKTFDVDRLLAEGWERKTAVQQISYMARHLHRVNELFNRTWWEVAAAHGVVSAELSANIRAAA